MENKIITIETLYDTYKEFKKEKQVDVIINEHNYDICLEIPNIILQINFFKQKAFIIFCEEINYKSNYRYSVTRYEIPLTKENITILYNIVLTSALTIDPKDAIKMALFIGLITLKQNN